MRKLTTPRSLALLAVLASTGLATEAISAPAMRQPPAAGLHHGPDAFITLVRGGGGGKGNVSVQRGNAFVLPPPPPKSHPYRPTVTPPPSPRGPGLPCYGGHCSHPDVVRDHRHETSPYRPTVSAPPQHSPRYPTHWGPHGAPNVTDHRHPDAARYRPKPVITPAFPPSYDSGAKNITDHRHK
jgi:hypothetical protein